MLSRGRKELAHVTEWEGSREAALGRPLLSVDVTMSYTSLGRKTMGGCWSALVREHWEACRTSVLVVGAVDEEDEPGEGSWEDEVPKTGAPLWLVLRLESGWRTGPGLCLLTADGGP